LGSHPEEHRKHKIIKLGQAKFQKLTLRSNNS
jgi:hypothetical protein